MADHIRLESSDKALSSLAGLSLFSSAFDRLISFNTGFDRLLPINKITPRTSSLEKFKAMTLGLVAGASCLDDMDRLRQDSAFVAINGEKVNAARTYDDFLHEFRHEDIKKMNLKLIDMGIRLHKEQSKDNNFILSIDSTTNEQSGQLIEGAAWNYKKSWGLDTLLGFDQFGHLLWHEVRAGNTFSSNGSPEVIYEALKRVPRNKHRYVLADSAFCNSAVFTACLQQMADFVIASRANMYGPWLSKIKEWKPSRKIKFHDGRSVDIGHTVYVTSGVNRIMRLIVLRTKGKDEAKKGPAIFEDTRYEYVAFVTTISQHNMSDESVIELYRTRANSENFIKDLKMGFDMYHYPCRKLSANKAYGIMMAVAYNLVRYAGYLLNSSKPLFAKAVRFLLVNIPCQLVRHGRHITFKMPAERLEEVRRIYEKITQLGYYASS